MSNARVSIIEFYIAITNRCNLKCIMCTTGKGKYDAQRELNSEEWKNIILNLNKNCKIQRITFGGGEPLLRDDLPEIMKFACSTDIATVNVISNGVLLNNQFLSKFKEDELKKIGFIISIDGLEYEHNFIRGTGIFKGVLENFENLFYNFYKRNLINSLGISSILLPENFSNYISFLKFFKKYDSISIDIQPVIPNNELCYVKNKFMLTEKEKIKLREIIDYLVSEPAISTRPASMIKYYAQYFDNALQKQGRCLTGYESLNITFEGYPYLCGKEIRMSLNNFDFKDIISSKGYLEELKRIEDCNAPCLQGLHINPDNRYE